MTKKYSILRQTLKMGLTSIGASFLSIFIALMLLGLTTDYSIAKIIVQIILLLLYGIWLFSAAYNVATTDHKSYVPLTPFALKGLVLSLGPIIFILLTWIFYLISWHLIPSAGSVSIIRIISTAIYLFSTSSVFEIIDISGDKANLIGQILAFILPALFCFVGYYLGYKKIDFTKYINLVMFEKKK